MNNPGPLSPRIHTYQGLFLPASAGHLHLGCYGELQGRRVWLYLPPFAEEMNLSRAIVSRQARAFAERGEAVVCLDYFGTGDSEGAFEQGSVQSWLKDIRILIDWLRAQGAISVCLWGLRFGALMAVEYLAENPGSGIDRLLLWKPVLDAKSMMGQFFRLKQVSESLQGGDKVDWLERVRQGETIEVAGYPVTPVLLEAMSALKITPEQLPELPPTLWLEAGAERISPVVAKLAAQWPEQRLILQSAAAPRFWQSPDCYHACELIQQTLSLSQAQGAADVY